MKRFQTLKSKLVFTGVLILTITVVVNLGIGVWLSYRGMQKNVEKDLKSISQAAQVAIHNSVDLMKENIQSVSARGGTGGTTQSEEEWAKALDAEKKNYGYTALYAAGKDGTILSSDSDYHGKNIAGQEYFKQALGGTVYLSAPVEDAAGKLAVIAAAPVSNSSFSGVVIGELDAQTYSNIVSKGVVVGQTGNVFIIDKTGVMIANKRPQLVEQRQNFIEMAKTDRTYATSAAVYQKMAAGKTGIDTYAYETGTRICYYQPLTGTDGWSCGTVAPLAEMMSEERSIVLGMSIASIFFIALGVFLMIKLAESVSAPIRLCSGRLLLLAQGDFHSEVPKVDAVDETGDLAKATAVLANGLREIVGDESFLLTSLAEGNFDVASHSDQYGGDLQSIQTSIEKIVVSLNEVFRQIGRSADQVAGGSGQVSNGAQLLAQGTTEQAGSVETLSKSLQGLSENIRTNAENAAGSSAKADRAKSELLAGSREIDGLMEAMEKIQTSSDKIGKIIQTVQDIAFQTNILALNAAVEAARAGEAGKGFSVVADEVRNLASKSEKASGEIAEMIAEMVQAVQQGSEITDNTRKAMLSIVDDTKEIIASVGLISGATQEQAETIQDIERNMKQISSVVQTNSATAEESAAASEELSSQAEEMRKLMGQFRLREEEGSAAPREDSAGNPVG